ncbi:kinetochore Sim4 complex subunit Fta4 [Lipomyces orientalis]|uniref:Kinetochore Sim4 complex subunit Fta4 n=1 Tax=Lipomyces orientalis TaxID=1233043 RepID=A0ACC3TR52_9ASCO
MANTQPPSVYDAKRAFVDAQARVFAAPLRPSARWLRQHPQAVQSPAVQRGLRHLHTLQRRHVHQVYSSQALQHVALQIDHLHRNRRAATASVAPLVVVSAAASEQQAVLRGDVDPAEPGSIKALPEIWPLLESEDEDLAHEYVVLRDQLLALSSALVAARRRHGQVAEIHSLVSFFREPTQTVQPNLVARDGNIEQELTRMRVLLARVAARLPHEHVA